MSSVYNRPRSQPPKEATYNTLTGSVSPNKNFKTRVIYKNIQVEEDPADKRSLYNQSYCKSPKAPIFQKPESRGSENGKMTLADIGTLSRTYTQKTPLNKKRSPGSETPVATNREHDRKGQSSGKKVVEITETIRHPAQNKARTDRKEHEKSSPELNQMFYESKLLKEAMNREFSSNPNINVDNDAEYYEAVKRLDECGKCWAAQQKYYTSPFKLKHKGPGQSLYQRDYVKHPLGEQGPFLKNDFYTTWQNNEPMDFGTTMKNDYKPWPVGPVKKETMNWRPATSGIPFAGKSQYRSEYVNWGANATAYEKAPHNTTIIPELPFMSRTTYGDNFGVPDATSQLKPVNKKNNKSPITTGIPFLGETTHNATYKPFKVSQVPDFGAPEEYEPTQALPEHLKSLYARDYAAPNHWKCPAVIFMEQNPHPRYRHLGI